MCGMCCGREKSQHGTKSYALIAQVNKSEFGLEEQKLQAGGVSRLELRWTMVHL